MTGRMVATCQRQQQRRMKETAYRSGPWFCNRGISMVTVLQDDMVIEAAASVVVMDERWMRSLDASPSISSLVFSLENSSRRN